MANFTLAYRRIQHSLNSLYANQNDRDVEKALNVINSQLYEMVNSKKKNKAKLVDIVEELKVERENMSPMNSTVLDLFDKYIEELEQVLNASKR